MKLSYIPLFLAAGLSTVAAQKSNAEAALAKLPDCAKECGAGTTPKHCERIDFKCTCDDKDFLAGVQCCVSQKCDADGVKAVIKFAHDLCSGVGVTELPDHPTCPATSSGASGASATASSPSSSSSDTSSSASPTSSSKDSGAVVTHNKDATLLAAVGAAAFAFLA